MPHGGPADPVLYLSAWTRSQLLGSVMLSLLDLRTTIAATGSVRLLCSRI